MHGSLAHMHGSLVHMHGSLAHIIGYPAQTVVTLNIPGLMEKLDFLVQSF
jgi:hypothetical protein